MKTYSFICSANIDRSKTAEDYFSEKHPTFHFLSAGTNKKICEQEGTNYIDLDILEISDRVFVMQSKHKKFIEEKFGSKFNSKIICLNIIDHFKYFDKQLIQILEDKLGDYLK